MAIVVTRKGDGGPIRRHRPAALFGVRASHIPFGDRTSGVMLFSNRLYFIRSYENVVVCMSYGCEIIVCDAKSGWRCDPRLRGV